LRGLKAAAGGDTSRIRNLVVTDGGAPDATLRAEFHHIFDGRPNKASIVSGALSNR